MFFTPKCSLKSSQLQKNQFKHSGIFESEHKTRFQCYYRVKLFQLNIYILYHSWNYLMFNTHSTLALTALIPICLFAVCWNKPSLLIFLFPFTHICFTLYSGYAWMFYICQYQLVRYMIRYHIVLDMWHTILSSSSFYTLFSVVKR